MTQAERNNILNAKLELEEPIRKALDKISAKIAKDFLNDNLILSIYNEDIELILEKHYKSVGDKFHHYTSDTLPDDVKATSGEVNEILAALALYYLTRAPQQMQRIQTTTKKNISEAFDFGATYAQQESARRGKPVTRREQKIVAANKLNQHLKARNGTIAARETQEVAELSRQVEVSVLAGQLALIIELNRNPLGVTKTWRDRGDERVRRPPKSKFNHVTPNGQEVDVNAPFIVSGESLMYPGDEQLGASLGNIINCRCYIEYSNQDIIRIRRQ